MLYERDVEKEEEKWTTAQHLPANLKVDESVHFPDLLGTEELPEHRMHFHRLLFLDLFVGSQDYAYG